jgi:L-malate glycosyltransferase
MRVIHLVLSLEVGGLEMVVLNLAGAATKSQVDCRVICLEKRGALAARFEALGVPVESLDADLRLPALHRLVGRLRELRPDVLHTHNPKPHFLGALARLFVPIPVLVHTKHGRSNPDNFRTTLYNRWASSRSEAVVAVSEDAARIARDLERVPSSKLVVLHNGIDGDAFDTPDRGHRPASRAICVARLSAVKDHATLLRATRDIVAVRPDFRLVLLGEGPERPRIEALRSELALERCVEIIGQVEDVRSRLAEADLFLLTSQSEGISIAILEAMAAGLPVIATDVGGNSEVVSAGETGLLVPVGSSRGLARAVLELLDDDARALAMGLAGRRRVAEHFDLEETAAAYGRLYSDLLARPSLTGSRRDA